MNFPASSHSHYSVLATHFNILGVSKRYICQEVFVKSIRICKDIDGVGEDN